jgi:hypothetical protein
MRQLFIIHRLITLQQGHILNHFTDGEAAAGTCCCFSKYVLSCNAEFSRLAATLANYQNKTAIFLTPINPELPIDIAQSVLDSKRVRGEWCI